MEEGSIPPGAARNSRGLIEHLFADGIVRMGAVPSRSKPIGRHAQPGEAGKPRRAWAHGIRTVRLADRKLALREPGARDAAQSRLLRQRHGDIRAQ